VAIVEAILRWLALKRAAQLMRSHRLDTHINKTQLFQYLVAISNQSAFATPLSLKNRKTTRSRVHNNRRCRLAPFFSLFFYAELRCADLPTQQAAAKYKATWIKLGISRVYTL
jgi:hypothetical protein